MDCSCRDDRLLVGAVVAFLLVASAGCTTSKAVRAWHDGWRAESAGDFERATKRYTRAFERNGGLVGAELGRLRLLARRTDQAAAVTAALKALMDEKGDRVSVQLFAAGWSLAQGDLATARKRLATVQQIAIDKADKPFWAARRRRSVGEPALISATPTSATSPSATPPSATPPSATPPSATRWCGPYAISWHRLRLRIRSRSGDYRGAQEAARQLVRGCGVAAGGLAADLARAYLGVGDAHRARQLLARGHVAATPELRALSAEIAFVLDEPKRVERLILRRADPRALSLRAWASWRAGRYHRAVARAARAIHLDTKQSLAVEVQVAAALAGNEPELAEGVLRGAVSLLGLKTWTLAFAEGILAVRSGKLRVAERAFARAVSRCPSCVPPRQNLAVLRRALGTTPTPVARPRPARPTRARPTRR